MLHMQLSPLSTGSGSSSDDNRAVPIRTPILRRAVAAFKHISKKTTPPAKKMPPTPPRNWRSTSAHVPLANVNANTRAAAFDGIANRGGLCPCASCRIARLEAEVIDPLWGIGSWNEIGHWSLALAQACRVGDVELAQTLLRHEHVNIEYDDGHGNTPLLMAAYHGHERIVRLLLLAGANPEARNEAGKTALTMSRFTQPASLVRLLESPPHRFLWRLHSLAFMACRLLAWRRRALERLYAPGTGAGYAAAHAEFRATAVM